MNTTNTVPSVLFVEGISKAFRTQSGTKVQALEALSFTLGQGQVVALVGPDGAGKSTLLRIIAGLLRPDTGKILFEGEPLTGENGGCSMGYMPQRFGLYEDLTVQENLDLYAELRGVSLEERENRYLELLTLCGMAPFRQRLAGKLSGGMKQKLGLVCTLVAPPKLLLLDEPTVGVDPLSRRELWDIVDRLADKTGMSVIVGTSSLEEAARCDEVMLFSGGKVLAHGTPEAIRLRAEGMSYLVSPAKGQTPRSLQAELLDAPGIIDAVPQGSAVRFVHGPLKAEEVKELMRILEKSMAHPVPASLEDSLMMLLREQQPEHPFVQEGESLFESTKDTKSNELDNGAPLTKASALCKEEPIIETEHVSRLFGDFIAVNDVSFSVYKGEVFGLLGPNGAGKTTTFRMLCGLLPASTGRLRVAGVDVRHARAEARRHIGYVAQKFSLYGPLSVRENLEFFAGAYGLRGKRKGRRVREMIEDFSLEEHLNSPAVDLPGGYRQRLAMAVGLLHEPAILFLDEPTSGADPLARREFWQRITRLAEQGVTIIITTHFMEEAEYCDRILIQDSGEMLALGTPAEIRALAFPSSGSETFVPAATSLRPPSSPVPGTSTSAFPSIFTSTFADTSAGLFTDVFPHRTTGRFCMKPDELPSPPALQPTMEDAFIHIVDRARKKARE